MTAVTSLTLTSPLTQGAAPIAVGQGFKKGDIPAGMYLTTDQSNLSCIPLATWNDGSLKHARLVGSVPLTANTPLTVNLSSTASVPVGASLTSANITAANPSASVQCGSLGTVNLSSLLSSPARTVASTPNMVECHYRSAIAGTNLLVWFHVRLFANGAIFIRAVVENGYLDNGSGAVASNADVSYVPTVTIGGAVAYNNGGASLTHCRNTRWKAEGWIGTDPQVTPSHNSTYLRASRLIPNYIAQSLSNAQLNALPQTYTPMSSGGIPSAMATPGANPTIGLLPQWDGIYASTGDARAYRAILAATDSLNSFGIVWRDYTTKDIVKPNSFATWSIYGPSQSNDRGINLSNGTGWEINHHPGIGYTGYLLTGDYWHYETLMLQLSFAWAVRGIMSINDPAHGSGTGRVLAHEVRGGSWSIRTMSIACGIMPDSEKAAGKVGAEYRDLLANNMAYWKSLVDAPGMNQIGMLYEYGQGGTMGAYGVDGWNPPWQHFWWVQSQGFGSDLEPLPDMTVYNAVRNFSYKSIVGILGDTATGYSFDCASTYVTKITGGNSLDPTTWFQTWAQVYAATFAVANNNAGVNSFSHTNNLLNIGNLIAQPTPDPVPALGGAGGPDDAWEGRWGYLLPAIAYAVDHGAPGASASWARVTGASNYSTLTGAFANTPSQWGVFPRTSGVVSVAHAVGPAIRFGRMRAGRITISKYHGNGIPASAIPATGTNGPALLYNDIDTVNDPVGTVYRLEMASPSPASGTFTLNEDSSFSLVGASDGNYTSTESIYKNGVLAYTSPFSATIGTVTATVTMVTVSPLTPSVAGGSTQQFSASVIGTNSPAQTVTWTASGGSINASTGLFTAPAATSSAQTITITATSTVDTSKSGTATVTVPAVVQTPTVTGVSVLPSTASVGGGGTQQFSATVLGANNPSQGVTWSVASGGGSINASGLFTAPSATSSTQTITVRATSTADSTKSGTATITVVALAPTVSSVTVSPGSATLGGFSQQQFSASVAGTNNPAQTVTWSATGGSITTGGLFTAPGSSGGIQTITVRATSSVDGSKSGTATVTIPALAPSVSSVSVSPASGTAQGASQVQFAASVAGLYSPSQAVTWSASAGSITSSGLWTAPSTTVSDQVVTITATSVVDSSKAGQANFTVPAFATPDAPAAVTATAGMETVAVTITVPAYDGGTPITGYIVTASNGQVQNVSGTSATFSIPAFTPVSFTAQAVNVMGAGAASNPSNTVIARPVESTNPADYSLEPAPRGRSMRS